MALLAKRLTPFVTTERQNVAPAHPQEEKKSLGRIQTRRVSSSEIQALRTKARSSTPAQLQTRLINDDRLDWKLLKKYGFDLRRFESDAARIATGTLTEAGSKIEPGFKPVSSVEEVTFSGAQAELMRTLGEDALRNGEVAVVVLNGGMATRFGGVVKGVVEVFDEKSFIGLKAEDVQRASRTYGAEIPFVVMNSFATDEATMKHVVDHQNFGLAADQILTFNQSISVRMNLDGSVFIGEDGKPSYHAPGHGDFFECIKRSGVLEELKKRGVHTVLFSNVDNLGATIDPIVIGHHLASGAEMTAELAQKQKTASGEWDKGASPVTVGDRVQLVEGFRLPGDLSPQEYPDLSTNNFLFDLTALEQTIPLERYVVKKKVKDQPVLQLESITCEASGAIGPDGKPLLDLHLIRVPREGENGRFFPIKEPEDLIAQRDALQARVEKGWERRDGA